MRVVLADYHPQRLLELRRIVEGHGLTCETTDAVSLEGLPARLGQGNCDLVIVLCDGRGVAAYQAITSARAVCDVPVIACGDARNEAIVAAAEEAGCHDFAPADQLRKALPEIALKIQAEETSADATGAVIAVASPSGGVGGTTTAINLAARLARRRAGRVALLDAQPAPTDMALLLDIEVQHSMDEVCRQWRQVDGRLLERTMIRHSTGVSVLAQSTFSRTGGITPRLVTAPALRKVVKAARRHFDFVVLDIEHELNDTSLEALNSADLVALLARADVPGLRRAAWMMQTALQMGVAREHFRLVLNRLSSGKISVAKAEELVGVKVLQSLPDDRRATLAAANDGGPLTGINKLSRGYASLARSAAKLV